MSVKQLHSELNQKVKGVREALKELKAELAAAAPGSEQHAELTAEAKHWNQRNRYWTKLALDLGARPRARYWFY